MKRQRRIAQPAVTVVPISYAADFLGKRGGRGGDNPARRSVGERLKRNERAQHSVTPPAPVGAAARPLTPVGFGVGQGLPRIDRVRRTAIRLSPTRDERDRLILLDLEQCSHARRGG